VACSLHRDCAFGLAVGLDLFQLHEHSVCLCSLPTESSPENLLLGDFAFVQGGLTSSNFANHPLIYSVSHFTLGDWSFVCGAKPTKPPVATGLVANSRLFQKLYYQTMPWWDIGLLDAQQWLQSLTLDGNCVAQLYSVQPLPSFTTISINALFNKRFNRKSYLNISFTLALGFQAKVLAQGCRNSGSAGGK